MSFAQFDAVKSVLDWARKSAREGVDRIRPVELNENGKKRFVIPGDPDYPDGGDREE